MSVIPATPQNRGQFYAIETPIPGGTGPTLYSRIFPGVITARFRHDDSEQDFVTAAIQGRQEWQSLGHLLVNRQQLEDVHGANVERILDPFRDRTYGGLDIDMDPTVEPTGSLAEVRQIMASGATVTQLRWPEDARPLDLWRFLPNHTRNILKKALIAPSQGTTVQ